MQKYRRRVNAGKETCHEVDVQKEERVRKEKSRRDVEGQVREASCGRGKKIPAKSRADMVNAGYHGLGYLRLVLATG